VFATYATDAAVVVGNSVKSLSDMRNSGRAVQNSAATQVREFPEKTAGVREVLDSPSMLPSQLPQSATKVAP
jgi:hypothetical protein